MTTWSTLSNDECDVEHWYSRIRHTLLIDRPNRASFLYGSLIAFELLSIILRWYISCAFRENILVLLILFDSFAQRMSMSKNRRIHFPTEIHSVSCLMKKHLKKWKRKGAASESLLLKIESISIWILWCLGLFLCHSLNNSVIIWH